MSTELEAIEGEEISQEMVPLQQSSPEIDTQISTARRFPRVISKFIKDAKAVACMDEDIASSCFYKLPRGGKFIEGPSIRLAEIMASNYGNMRFSSKIVEEQEKVIVAQAICWDLEKNIAVNIEVRRKITDKWGKRYNDDMVEITGKAACAIAERNAILKIIPRSYSETVLSEAKKIAIGDASTLVARRTQAIEYFQKMGVSLAQILTKLEKAGVDDIDLNDLEILTGLKSAIKDGISKVDEVFLSITVPVSNPNLTKTQNLAEKIKSV